MSEPDDDSLINSTTHCANQNRFNFADFGCGQWDLFIALHMARRKKSEDWRLADPVRIRAFAYSLMPNGLQGCLVRKPNAADIQQTLEKCELAEPFSDATIRKWLAGKSKPRKNIEAIRATLPECVAWLDPDIESSPIRRFLCALDAWGSSGDSPVRKVKKEKGRIITVDNALSSLAKLWGPLPITKGGDEFYGFAIPKLRCHAPKEVPNDIYQSHNRSSLMDFMFRCGPYLELSGHEFQDWAIDLASLALFVSAYFEGRTFADRSLPGRTGDYSFLVYDIFFLPHDSWPNEELIKLRLEDFPEFDALAADRFSQRLMQACDVLRKELHFIGCDFSFAKELLTKRRPSSIGQPPFPNAESFDKDKLIRPKRDLLPAAPERYKYEFRSLANGERIVLCHDLENGTQTSLTERPDLFNGYAGQFAWGYRGEGPRFLVTSLLAHHLGHSNFDFEAVDRLLNKYIAKFPEKAFETSFILTTQLIDLCING